MLNRSNSVEVNESNIELLDIFEPLWSDKPTRYYIITGGRGSFKSYTVGIFLSTLMLEKGHVILSSRYTLSAAERSVIPEFNKKTQLLIDDKQCPPDTFITKRDEVINRYNNSLIFFKGIHTTSGNQTANLKSIEGLTTFVLDEAEEVTNEDDFDTIDASIRTKGIDNRVIMIMNPASFNHWIYKRFFESKGVPYDFNGVKDDVTYIFSCYTLAPDLLSPSFLSLAQRTKETNLKKYNHLFLGHWSDDTGKTLWQRKHIQYKTLPDMVKVVVAIDPAITSNPDSDETGIIVIGKGTDNCIYVLDDISGRYTPGIWASRAVMAYEKYGGSVIVAEVNQGGEMVKNTILSVSKAVLVETVHASVGKFTRAEPVFAYYEQGMVFHSRVFTDLEFQMTTWQPEDKNSPDRMDALVWGVTYLMKAGANSIIYAS